MTLKASTALGVLVTVVTVAVLAVAPLPYPAVTRPATIVLVVFGLVALVAVSASGRARRAKAAARGREEAFMAEATAGLLGSPAAPVLPSPSKPAVPLWEEVVSPAGRPAPVVDATVSPEPVEAAAALARAATTAALSALDAGRSPQQVAATLAGSLEVAVARLRALQP